MNRMPQNIKLSKNARPVLVVDDEYYVTRGISYLLQDEGLSCITKNDSDGVIELVAKERPQVIVLDINIPKVDGFQVLKEVRQRKDFDDVVIMILTARGHEEDIQAGLALGANEYILKPFNPLELRDKIKAVYAAKQGH